MEEIPVIATGGNATQVTDGEGLSAAFESGFKPGALVAAGDDIITAENSTSSVIVYGDVLNTDRLQYELRQNLNIDAALVAAGIGYGSGMEVLQWLENNGDKLTDTKFEGWPHDDSVKYMIQHAEELGYETRVDDNGGFYLVNADGTVLNMDGTEANADLDSLTGRGGGDDVITGSEASDTIYGQEGHDTIYGGGGHDSLYGGTGDDLLVGDDKPENLMADTVDDIKELVDNNQLDAFIESVEEGTNDGNDQLFGGAGNDVLLGMGGDDYLNGGAGEDAIFGGAGNDIIVYDSDDYLVSGGSGIDFMVSTQENLSLDKLLSNSTGEGDGPIVDSIEVLITGKDALSLTSIDQLAESYGIHISTGTDGKESLLLDESLWSTDENGSGYTFHNDGADLHLQVANDVSVEVGDADAIAVAKAEMEHSNG